MASMRCGPGSASARSSASVNSSAVVARAAGDAHAPGQRDEVEVGPGEVEHVERLRARALGADPAAAPC